MSSTSTRWKSRNIKIAVFKAFLFGSVAGLFLPLPLFLRLQQQLNIVSIARMATGTFDSIWKEVKP
jgi:hypothetical protein